MGWWVENAPKSITRFLNDPITIYIWWYGLTRTILPVFLLVVFSFYINRKMKKEENHPRDVPIEGTLENHQKQLKPSRIYQPKTEPSHTNTPEQKKHQKIIRNKYNPSGYINQKQDQSHTNTPETNRVEQTNWCKTQGQREINTYETNRVELTNLTM